MNPQQVAGEALARARGGLSGSNYPAIFLGFADKGIPEEDIRPRENILTYHAWRALGRQVRRGEHGVRITTWVPVPAKTSKDGKEVRAAGKYCKAAVVFHVSQTDQI